MQRASRVGKEASGPKREATKTLRKSDAHFSFLQLLSTYRNQCRLKEAEEFEVHDIEMEKKILGLEHPERSTGR